MDANEAFALWQSFDADTKAELSALAGNQGEIEERFGKKLSFGTGGLRGKMGAGTNRINAYTIAGTTQGYALFLTANFTKEELKKGVVIAYDTRHHSEAYAKCAAAVLKNHEIAVYLFSKPTPTPVLSFAIGHLGALGGIVITASHNPKEYNGYKIYNAWGGQLVPKEAAAVYQYIKKVKITAEVLPQAQALNDCVLGEEIYRSYEESLLLQQRSPGKKQLRIIYSPLHGTGYPILPGVLLQAGFQNISVVEKQSVQDGNFPTVSLPNPEDAEAFSMGIACAEKNAADVVFATDPDCDRIGVAVRDKKNYVMLNGNEIGALLCEYLLRRQRGGKGTPVLIKTIVTGELGADIGRSLGAEVINTLTGFKYIGEKMIALKNCTDKFFLFGYEESCGYLCGEHAKDKDAVVAALLIAEMADVYHQQGVSLLLRLEELYRHFGYRYTTLTSYGLEQEKGVEKMSHIMARVRQDVDHIFPENIVLKDYLSGIEDLPEADVVKMIFEDQSWLALRPSGTEPKLKVYYEIKGASKAAAKQRQRHIQKIMEDLFQK